MTGEMVQEAKYLLCIEDWRLDPLAAAEISGGHGDLAIIPEKGR